MLRLRGRDGRVLAELTRPPGTPAAVLVFIGATHRPLICGALGTALQALTLSLADATRDHASTLLDWTADHADQFVDDPDQLIIAGLHAGAGLAATLALQARDQRWPTIARQILIHPSFPAQDERQPRLDGVAPATIATRDAPGRRYAHRLRHAGVAVTVLEHEDPFIYANALPGAKQLLAELAAPNQTMAPQPCTALPTPLTGNPDASSPRPPRSRGPLVRPNPEM